MTIGLPVEEWSWSWLCVASSHGMNPHTTIDSRHGKGRDPLQSPLFHVLFNALCNKVLGCLWTVNPSFRIYCECGDYFLRASHKRMRLCKSSSFSLLQEVICDKAWRREPLSGMWRVSSCSQQREQAHRGVCAALYIHGAISDGYHSNTCILWYMFCLVKYKHTEVLRSEFPKESIWSPPGSFTCSPALAADLRPLVPALSHSCAIAQSGAMIQGKVLWHWEVCLWRCVRCLLPSCQQDLALHS